MPTRKAAKKAQQKAIKAAHKRRGLLHAIKRSNQYLPFANGGIGINQFAEVIRVLVQVDRLLDARGFNLGATEVRAAIILHFVFDVPATSVDGICLSRLTKAGRADTPVAGQLKLPFSGPRRPIVQICLSGRLDGVPFSSINGLYRMTQDRFCLFLPILLEAPVNAWLSRPGLVKGERVFSQRLIEQFPHILRAICSAASLAANWRITPIRLKSFFHRFVLNDERVPPELLAYWQGRLVERQRAAPHYAVISIETINQIFQEVWLDIIKDVATLAEYQDWRWELLRTFGDPDDPHQSIDPEDAVIPAKNRVPVPKGEYKPYPKVSFRQLNLPYEDSPSPQSRIGYEAQPFIGLQVGTSMMVSGEKVKQLVRVLQRELLEFGNGQCWDLSRAIEIYSLYTALVILLGSAVRPNKMVIPAYGVCLNWQLLFADDKGRLRPIFCAPVVTEQVLAYRSFLNQLRFSLAKSDPELALTLNTILHDDGHKPSALIYHVDANGAIAPISRRWLDDQFEKYTGLSDAYLCRRYVRSELAQRRVPSAILGAFMGHRERGNGVGQPFSFYSLKNINEALNEPLSITLYNLGVKAFHFDHGYFGEAER